MDKSQLRNCSYLTRRALPATRNPRRPSYLEASYDADAAALQLTGRKHACVHGSAGATHAPNFAHAHTSHNASFNHAALFSSYDEGG